MTADELCRELERMLGRPVVRVGRRPYAYETSHPLEELDVELADGTALRVLSKDAAAAADSKPAFLHDPSREIVVYKRLLAPSGLGTATFYGNVGSRLFIEKVEGVELWQVGELDAWQHAARWLARMHAVLGGWSGDAPLLRYDRDFYRVWLDRARAFTGDLAPVARIYDHVAEYLLALPQTIVHGEFYASNILVAGSRVCPVDWEMAGRGAGVLDLAALTSGWPESEQRAIAAAYGAVPERALDAARLHLAVRWLGWSRDWTPPAEHRRDWLREALDLSERLDL